ncbi:hypothetical protein [Sporichthya polymorpha]|uniref:hypothetical protein n=1 Tax=Sporichthya polymorpha TaxID=35751 RepID=UPI000364A3AB|nr:hypothetical protein [Sporichthya polymorpha]
MTDSPSEKSLGASDWDDEDLLTIAEASERLAEEIRRARERGDDQRVQELTEAAERIAAARNKSI